jgi:hypothetical protein
MDRQQRYRQRLKLQAALAKVLKLLDAHAAARIAPDERTASLAVEVRDTLEEFIAAAFELKP